MSETRRQAKRAGTCEAAQRTPLPVDVVESVAEWLRLIAVPTRIRLIEALEGGCGTLQGLASRLGTTRQNTYKHLAVLSRAGIVRRRKVGRRVHYELADWAGWWMVRQAAASMSEDPSRPDELSTA